MLYKTAIKGQIIHVQASCMEEALEEAKKIYNEKYSKNDQESEKENEN